MPAIPPLLVATDLSPTGKIVLEKAFKLAEKYNKPLFILHVVESSLFSPKIINLDQVKAHLEEILAPFYERHSQVESTLLCRQGDIEKSIVQAIAETQASTLIISTSGEDHLLRELFLGSHCRKIIRASPIPVLVVKNDETPNYSRIFLPTDFSTSSRQIVSRTLQIFPQATLSLFHVVLKPFEQRLGMYGLDKEEIRLYHKELDEKSSQQAQEFLDSLDSPAWRSRTRLLLESGIFSTKLCLQKLRESESNLIALSTTGNISFFSMDILNQSPKDVLIFKTDKLEKRSDKS